MPPLPEPTVIFTFISNRYTQRAKNTPQEPIKVTQRKLRQENPKFKTDLNYTKRPGLKRRK